MYIVSIESSKEPVTDTLNITAAPTLVVVTKEGTEVVENVSNIRRYIELNLVK